MTRQILIAAKFRLQNRDRRLILHKICHFQPFLKFELSKKFPCGPPFAKMPKMSDFSGLENLRLRCVQCLVSGTIPVSIYHLGWAGRIRNSPYMNFVHPPGLPSFFFEPPSSNLNFSYPPPPNKKKKKKEKETETPTLALLQSTDKQ